MSAASCSRSASAARARCSSKSGRRPAFHASMKSLRMRSGSGGTEDPLQFLHAAAAALVDVFRADREALGDGGAVELLDVRQLEHRTVVVVAQRGRSPSARGSRPPAGSAPRAARRRRGRAARRRRRRARRRTDRPRRRAPTSSRGFRPRACGGAAPCGRSPCTCCARRGPRRRGTGRPRARGSSRPSRSRAGTPRRRRCRPRRAAGPVPPGNRKPLHRILMRSKLFSVRRSQVCAASASRPRSRATT